MRAKERAPNPLATPKTMISPIHSEVNHNVVITSDKKLPREGQRDDSASLESSGSDKMIVRLRTDLSIHYSEDHAERDNTSRETIAEHLHRGSVHAQSPV